MFRGAMFLDKDKVDEVDRKNAYKKLKNLIELLKESIDNISTQKTTYPREDKKLITDQEKNLIASKEILEILKKIHENIKHKNWISTYNELIQNLLIIRDDHGNPLRNEEGKVRSNKTKQYSCNGMRIIRNEATNKIISEKELFNFSFKLSKITSDMSPQAHLNQLIKEFQLVSKVTSTPDDELSHSELGRSNSYSSSETSSTSELAGLDWSSANDSSSGGSSNSELANSEKKLKINGSKRSTDSFNSSSRSSHLSMWRDDQGTESSDESSSEDSYTSRHRKR